MILPNNKSWNNIADLSHYAGIKSILNLLNMIVIINLINLKRPSFFRIKWNIIGRQSFIITNILTHIQKKNAISKEFWNRIIWISKSTSLGLLNQKCSSEGLTTNSPSTATCFSATSWANWIITCSNLVPTASRSYIKYIHHNN